MASADFRSIRGDLRNYYLDGVFSQAMGTLTGGAFLAGLALELGASDLVIGLIAALPFLSKVFYIPAIWLVERVRRRRAICVVTNAASRPLWLLIGLAPLFFPQRLGLTVLLGALGLYSIIATISNLSWSTWIRDLIPEEVRGRAVAQRMWLIGWVGMALSLVAAEFVDWWRGHFGQGPLPFTLLFGLGSLMGLVGVYFLAKIPEPPMPPSQGRPSLLRLLRLPLADRNFLRLIGFSSSWAFSTNLALPFITIYMLKILELPYIYILAFTALSQMANLALVRIWGAIADRFGNKAVLYLCTPVFSLSLILWVFTVKGNPLISLGLIALIHLMNGTATAGLDLANNNILMRLSPPQVSSAYLATASLANSLAAGVAPLLGGLLGNFFADKELSLGITWVSGASRFELHPLRLFYLDFLFLFAFLLGFYALRRLPSVREVEREVPRREVIRAVRQEIQGISTIRGMRHLTHVASHLAGMVLAMGGLVYHEPSSASDRQGGPGSPTPELGKGHK